MPRTLSVKVQEPDWLSGTGSPTLDQEHNELFTIDVIMTPDNGDKPSQNLSMWSVQKTFVQLAQLVKFDLGLDIQRAPRNPDFPSEGFDDQKYFNDLSNGLSGSLKELNAKRKQKLNPVARRKLLTFLNVPNLYSVKIVKRFDLFESNNNRQVIFLKLMVTENDVEDGPLKSWPVYYRFDELQQFHKNLIQNQKEESKLLPSRGKLTGARQDILQQYFDNLLQLELNEKCQREVSEFFGGPLPTINPTYERFSFVWSRAERAAEKSRVANIFSHLIKNTGWNYITPLEKFVRDLQEISFNHESSSFLRQLFAEIFEKLFRPPLPALPAESASPAIKHLIAVADRRQLKKMSTKTNLSNAESHNLRVIGFRLLAYPGYSKVISELLQFQSNDGKAIDLLHRVNAVDAVVSHMESDIALQHGDRNKSLYYKNLVTIIGARQSDEEQKELVHHLRGWDLLLTGSAADSIDTNSETSSNADQPTKNTRLSKILEFMNIKKNFDPQSKEHAAPSNKFASTIADAELTNFLFDNDHELKQQGQSQNLPKLFSSPSLYILAAIEKCSNFLASDRRKTKTQKNAVESDFPQFSDRVREFNESFFESVTTDSIIKLLTYGQDTDGQENGNVNPRKDEGLIQTLKITFGRTIAHLVVHSSYHFSEFDSNPFLQFQDALLVFGEYVAGGTSETPSSDEKLFSRFLTKIDESESDAVLSFEPKLHQIRNRLEENAILKRSKAIEQMKMLMMMDKVDNTSTVDEAFANKQLRQLVSGFLQVSTVIPAGQTPPASAFLQTHKRLNLSHTNHSLSHTTVTAEPFTHQLPSMFSLDVSSCVFFSTLVLIGMIVLIGFRIFNRKSSKIVCKGNLQRQ